MKQQQYVHSLLATALVSRAEMLLEQQKGLDEEAPRRVLFPDSLLQCRYRP